MADGLTKGTIAAGDGALTTAATSESTAQDSLLAGKVAATFHESPALDYEFTNDPALLEQYYQLREQMFISVWGLKRFHGVEDAFDKDANTLIARMGNLCVGGARILMKVPGNSNQLPMEGDDFNLEQLLPELPLARVPYGEFSRLALLPEFRGGKYTRQIYYYLNRKALALGLHYVFALSPLSQARSYRRTYLQMGFDYSILDHVAIPQREEFEGIRMYLSMLDLTSFFAEEEAAGVVVSSDISEEV